MDPQQLETQSSRRARPIAKLLIQLIGFLIGLALLAWALRMGFSSENQEQFKTLGNAPWYQVAGLVALALGTLAINGLVFFVALLPVRRLGVIDLQAVSAIASLFSYLPFKMSLIFRTVYHNRRDGVPLFTIAAWFGAIGVLIPAFLAPVFGASAIRREIDLLWVAMVVAGVAVIATAVVLLSRYLGPGKGLGRLQALADSTRVKPLGKFVRSASFSQLHAGVVMLASVRAVGSNAVLRLTDIALHGIRFKLAATMLGVELGWSEAIVSGAFYFFIGASAPTGSLGMREGLTIGLAATIGIASTDAQIDIVAAIAQLVTASELPAFLLGTGLGIVWLNPLKLIALSRGTNGTPPPDGSDPPNTPNSSNTPNASNNELPSEEPAS